MKNFDEIKEIIALKYVKAEPNYTAFQVLERDYTPQSLSKIYKEVCEFYHNEKNQNFKNEIIEDLMLIQKNWYAKNFIQEIVYKRLNKINYPTKL